MNDDIKLAKYIKCIHNTLTEIPICDIITKTGYICKVEAVHLVEIGNQNITLILMTIILIGATGTLTHNHPLTIGMETFLNLKTIIKPKELKKR